MQNIVIREFQATQLDRLSAMREHMEGTEIIALADGSYHLAQAIQLGIKDKCLDTWHYILQQASSIFYLLTVDENN